MSSLKKIQDGQFDGEVLKSDHLTLVDFGAAWCGPCKALQPILEDLQRDYDGRVKIVEVDVGDSPQTAMKYGITSVPQLLFFKEGSVQETVVGLLPKAKIQRKIEDYL